MYRIIKLLLISLLTLFVLTCHSDAETVFQKEVIKQSEKYVGIREVAQNRGPGIDTFHKWMGMPPSSWCLMFALYPNYEAAQILGIKNPYPKMVRVYYFNETVKKNPIRFKYFTYQEALITRTLEPADIIIWKSGAEKENWNGHAGLFLDYIGTEKNLILTRQGNTSSKGSSRESEKGGDGVYDKVVDINFRGKMKVIGFVRSRDANKR